MPIDAFETYLTDMTSTSRRVWLLQHIQVPSVPNLARSSIPYGIEPLRDLDAALLSGAVVAPNSAAVRDHQGVVAALPSKPVAVHDHHYFDMTLFSSTPAYVTCLRTMRYFVFLQCVMKFRATASPGDENFLTTAIAAMAKSVNPLRRHRRHLRDMGLYTYNECSPFTPAECIPPTSGDWVCHHLANVITNGPRYDFRLSATYLANRRYVINMLTLPQGPAGGGEYDVLRWMNKVYCARPDCTTPYCDGYDCLSLFQQAVQRAISWWKMPTQWRFPDGSIDVSIIRSLLPTPNGFARVTPSCPYTTCEALVDTVLSVREQQFHLHLLHSWRTSTSLPVSPFLQLHTASEDTPMFFSRPS